MLALVMLVAPIIEDLEPEGYPWLSEISLGVIFIGMLLSAVFAVSEGRRMILVAWLLAAPTILAWVISLVVANEVVAIGQHVLAVIFVGYAVVVIVRFLFVSQRVTTNVVAASLCVYLLLAVMWAQIFTLMEVLEPGTFRFGPVEASGEWGAAGRGEMAFGLYYSLVTMTTLGYGDIVPISKTAQMFSAVEAVTGQLYLTVLVARLVGLHIVHSTSQKGSP